MSGGHKPGLTYKATCTASGAVATFASDEGVIISYSNIPADDQSYFTVGTEYVFHASPAKHKPGGGKPDSTASSAT
jgi:hypothetical protein